MTERHLVLVPPADEQTDLERLLLASLNAKGVARIVEHTVGRGHAHRANPARPTIELLAFIGEGVVA